MGEELSAGPDVDDTALETRIVDPAPLVHDPSPVLVEDISPESPDHPPLAPSGNEFHWPGIETLTLLVTLVAALFGLLQLGLSAVNTGVLLVLMVQAIAAAIWGLGSRPRRLIRMMPAVGLLLAAGGYGVIARDTEAPAQEPAATGVSAPRWGASDSSDSAPTSFAPIRPIPNSELWDVAGTSHRLLRTGDRLEPGWLEHGHYPGGSANCGAQRIARVGGEKVYVHACVHFVTPRSSDVNETQWVVVIHNSSGRLVSATILDMAFRGVTGDSPPIVCQPRRISYTSGAACVSPPIRWIRTGVFTAVRGKVILTFPEETGTSPQEPVDLDISVSTGY